MSVDLRTFSDDELEAALRDLGRALSTPASPSDPAHGARLRLEAHRESSSGPSWPRVLRSPVRGMALALVALLLLAGLAVALGLGVPGIRIILIGPSPSSSPTSSPSASPLVSPSPTMTLIESLRLGQSVDLALLDVAAGFHVRRPDLAGLGTPDAAVLSLAAGAHQASLLYVGTAAQGLGTGDPAALLITEFPATISRDFLDKYVATGTTVVPVHVHTQAGYWLSGAPHELAYLDPHGQVILDRVRLAGNVLLWNDGTVTYRIEGARDLAAALAIAGSLR